MPSESEPDFRFQIIISRPFQKTMEKTRDQPLRARVYECMGMLAKGFGEWKELSVRKIDIGEASVRSARINEQMRILFEGPIETKRFRPVLFIHDICNDNEYRQAIRRVAGVELDERELPEIELTSEEMIWEGRGLKSDMVAFSKPIPAKALLSPERMDAILGSDKANLLLTRRQLEALFADSPLFIHGRAGSGKTIILCHHLAQSVLSPRIKRLARLVFLSYSDKLVKQAERDTKEILRDLYFASENLEGVNFTRFQTFLKRYVPNPSRFEEHSYVSFGRFKQYYENYRRGYIAARRIPAEVAWHGIRSILKGACKPPLRPPLSPEDYKGLARKRKEFPEDIFNDIYRIGEWYQRDVIQEKGLWDDQDLAWEALNWVRKEKERNPKMELYDQIFCDEVQDLTQIEFLLLVALCKQPVAEADEGLSLVLAGDPLQTINPTGFRWSIIRSEIYPVQGRPVKLHELQENFRSDKMIVSLANRIQEVRSHYMKETIEPQVAFEKEGEMPQVVTADTEDEISIVQRKLGELTPESAVIVWPEESDEVEQLYKTEEALRLVDRELDLYTISEAKGLEFQRVVLYKFGSSPDALKWKDSLIKYQECPLKDEIPLLYFLNRLYVAVTRAKLFLIIIDTKSGVDNFWSIWKDLHIVPRDEIRRLFEEHRAWISGDISDVAWRRWAEVLYDHAERTHDLRLYERAKRAYEKAGEKQSVRLIDARIREINEDWEGAAVIYDDLNDFERAGYCYEVAKKWSEAHEAYAKLPTTPGTKRRMAICKFKRDIEQNAPKAAREFYEYAMEDENLERKYLDELGDVLLQAGDNKRAAEIFLRIARTFNDKAARRQAAHCFYNAGIFERAEQLFEEAGDTKRPEYELSRAENLLQKEEWYEAARLFFKNEAFEKVVEVYELAKLKGRTLTGQLLEWAAESYFKLQRWGRAYATYETLISEHGRADTETLQRIAECLEKLGDKAHALEYYKKARSHKEVARLAEELGRPREEVLRIRIEEAHEKGDFDSAIKFAKELGDERLMHKLKGHSQKYRKEYREAIQEFIEAEEWIEAIECALAPDYVLRADFSELYNQWCNIVGAVAKSQKGLSQTEKERLMALVQRIRVEPNWEQHVPPPDMGLVYEKCAMFVEAAYYFESYIHEKWAREGWLRVKYAHRDYYKQKGDFENAERIDEEIRRRMRILLH